MEKTPGKDKNKVPDIKLVEKKFVEKQQNAFKRFPLLFTMLAAFGVVITYNGIHDLVQKVDWLNRNPVVTLIVGILILLFTGTLYKKL